MESTGELTAHLTTGATVVYVLEWVKRSKVIPWITPATTSLNRIASALVAAALAIGINWQYDSASGDLVIHGLTWGSVFATFYEWLKQFIVQQATFDAIVARKKETVP